MQLESSVAVSWHVGTTCCSPTIQTSPQSRREPSCQRAACLAIPAAPPTTQAHRDRLATRPKPSRPRPCSASFRLTRPSESVRFALFPFVAWIKSSRHCRPADSCSQATHRMSCCGKAQMARCSRSPSRSRSPSAKNQDLRFEPTGRGAIEVVFTGNDPLPRSLSARIWQLTAPTTKPFVIAVSGPTFVVRGLLAGEYQVSAHSFEGRTMSSGNGSVGVASGTTTRLPIAWKIRQR